IIEASTIDPEGRETSANREVWVAGTGDWWFAATDSDRMDLLAEDKQYEPGETARLQVRMPFRQATVLVTVEREGIAETYVRELSGTEPVIELPVKAGWAPNVFISVLAVRGRVGDVQPGGLVDLGRPAFRLGIAELRVGWKAHELMVTVETDRPVYKVREKARAGISVATADGRPLPPGSEVVVAAVDEGLLELMPNESWDLLGAMMGRRAYGVRTATAQMHVVGKRHFGLKALPQGGGGGRVPTRELFDTLLLWQGRVKLDKSGRATVEIPLNDSLTGFRIVAVATGGVDRFGTGSASIRTTQDLMLFSGIPPFVRQGDDFTAVITVRNAADRSMPVSVSMRMEPASAAFPNKKLTLAPGESEELRFRLTVPAGTDSLRYTIEASGRRGASDRLSVMQKVAPLVPVRTFQATIEQLDRRRSMPVERPVDALSERGGVRVSFQPRLADGLKGVTEFMERYDYSCLEQVISKAVALRDESQWQAAMTSLPVHIDGDGLLKYFPSMMQGDDVLTAYVLSVAGEAGWDLPADAKERMIEGLTRFIDGRLTRLLPIFASDLTMRKLAAIEALSREGRAEPGMLSSITIAPNLWPTSAVLDWFAILPRMTGYRDRDRLLAEAENILRSRLNFQGTTMGFSTERSDRLWWLMVSGDVNAVRMLLSVLDNPAWKDDIPRLVRGALGRQRQGRWDTTVANAWGVLAMETFSALFESAPVAGLSTAGLAGKTGTVDWQATPYGDSLLFPWPDGRETLDLAMQGTGRPWAVIQSLAAIPLEEPLSSGFRIKRTVMPIERKAEGQWHVGDTVRVKLEIESQADMTWIVVNDPVPSGATILGSGMGLDSQLTARGEERTGRAWPAFTERRFETFRAYYRYVPKGNWSVEYTLRLNNAGIFNLPPTRIEAMYAPEMFGELPNESIEVK
ncbi:MAG TPA: alpha-2-macroglobulin family protein, partial [Acidobacteriota bacterium]|nr:alpha-2-macroglobulin family protein [Acidobacteriota bacterium]